MSPKSAAAMGERLQHLALTAFRGVPDTWDVTWHDGASMVVLGDNGTGKSTIADALEWYFNGRIGFLTREGRDRAIRHVGAATSAITSVAVTTSGTLGGTEYVPTAGSPWLEPRVADNFVLRGRTLSDFVDQPKAEKWRTLAGILGLDHVDGLRLDLQKVRNQLEGEAATAQEDARLLEEALRPSLHSVTANTLFAAIGVASRTAGLQAPSTLPEALDQDWLPAALQAEVATGVVETGSLKADLGAIRNSSVDLTGIDTWNVWIAGGDSGIHDRLAFAQSASKYLDSHADDGRCPLCGQQADWADIQERVSATLETLRSVAETREHAEHAIQAAIDVLEEHDRRLGELQRRAAHALATVTDRPTTPTAQMRGCRGSLTAIPRDSVKQYLEACTSWLGELDTALDTLPPARSRDANLVALFTLCDQGRRWQQAERKAARAREAFKVANRLHGIYARHESERYSSILASISSRVAGVYEFLHPDEGLTGVAVESWSDKGLELAVDFHGTHQKPPHGVLSESHLNSLAVALFLTMAEMFNQALDFVVLDDVVNSFDVAHRGRLAELLVSEFSGQQLIVLTHDHQFYLHLARRAPSWSTLELTSWAFDEGPRSNRYSTVRLVDAAREALDSGDVQGSAQKARRALEEMLDEACEALGARLPYRRGHANDRRELAELMSGLRSQLRSSARDWYRELAPLLTDLEADVQAALNVEVHTGRGWSSRAEVTAALERIARLDWGFTCFHCRSRIWARGDYRAARCTCGMSHYPPSPPPPEEPTV